MLSKKMKAKRKMKSKIRRPGKSGANLCEPETGRPLRRGGIGLALALIAWLTLAATPAPAKKKPRPTKTLSGQVLDASNHAVAGADVELTDLTTKKKLDIYTQQNGSYEFGGLSFDHNYRVQAHYQGQSSPSRMVSSWDPRAELVMNLYLRPSKK